MNCIPSPSPAILAHDTPEEPGSQAKETAMATMEEVYEKVVSDDGEKAAFTQALATKEGIAAFLSERGCDATLEEFAAFLKERAPKQGELGDEELEGAAGGGGSWWEKLIFSIGTAGICLILD